MKKINFTHEDLKEFFTYSDGNLIWIKKTLTTGRCIKIGNKAGTKCGKYIKFSFMGSFIGLHTAIFFYHNGYIPEVVDHEDRNPLNNKIENLRKSTISQNQQNRAKKKKSTSTYKGVYRCDKRCTPKKFSSSIGFNGSRKLLGYFRTELEAVLAYNRAAVLYHGEFAYLNIFK